MGLRNYWDICLEVLTVDHYQVATASFQRMSLPTCCLVTASGVLIMDHPLPFVLGSVEVGPQH